MSMIDTQGEKGKGKPTYSIYIIFNTINGKMYVGASKNPIRRWKRHKSIALSVSPTVVKNAIHFALKKYSSEKFTFKIVEGGLSFEEAMKREIEWIAFLKDLKHQLYNETNGGDSGPIYEWSEDQRKKQSERMSGKNNYFYGMRLTGKANGHYGHKMKPHVKKELLKHRAKLTPQQVQNIKRLYETGDYTQTKLSEMFEVSLTQIHKIVHGKRWNGDKNNDAPLFKGRISKNQVIEIREKYDSGEYTQAALTKMFNLSAAQIHRIVKRKRWKNI